MLKLLAFAALVMGLMVARPCAAETIVFDDYTMVGHFVSEGLYDLTGLETWNGQPIAPDNMPSDGQRRLRAAVRLYVHPDARNVLYVQVADVITTEGAFWFGTAFNNVTQTGLRMSLFLQPSAVAPPAFSDDFANPGQVRAFGGATETVEPLVVTPGYDVASTAGNPLLLRIATVVGAENGFTSLGNIHGASRIRGGGVFQLSFDSGVDLISALVPGASRIEAEYGAGSQYIESERCACGDGIVSDLCAEQCDDGGAADHSCCSNTCQIKSIETPCRPVAGPCDVAESCTGDSSICPIDGFQPRDYPCRGSMGACDLDDVCSGEGSFCADLREPDGTVCDDGDSCTSHESCDTGVCGGGDTVSCPYTCGNGVLDLGEQCDDANEDDGDCCSADCRFEIGPCADDGSACTTDQCDGAGSCDHLGVPQPSCIEPVIARQSSLKMRSNPDGGKNLLQWKWKKGTSTKSDFRNPLADEGYELCLYDASALVASMSVNPGGVCGGRPCWKENSAGYAFSDRSLASDGLSSIALKGNDGVGRAQISVNGKRALLPVPLLGTIHGPVVVQLHQRSGPTCWQTVHSAPFTRSTETQFSDKSD